MTNFTPEQWAREVVRRMPRSLHYPAQMFSGALIMSGRNPFSHLGLIPWFADTATGYRAQDKLLSSLQRLVDTGWVEYLDDSFHLRIPTEHYVPKIKAANGRKRNTISARVKRAVYARDNWACWLCGMGITPRVDPDALEDWSPCVDHVVPHSQGGSDSIENLRAAHHWCNVIRGDRNPPLRQIMWARWCIRTSTQAAVWEFAYELVGWDEHVRRAKCFSADQWRAYMDHAMHMAGPAGDLARKEEAEYERRAFLRGGAVRLTPYPS